MVHCNWPLKETQLPVYGTTFACFELLQLPSSDLEQDKIRKCKQNKKKTTHTSLTNYNSSKTTTINYLKKKKTSNKKEKTKLSSYFLTLQLPSMQPPSSRNRVSHQSFDIGAVSSFALDNKLPYSLCFDLSLSLSLSLGECQSAGIRYDEKLPAFQSLVPDWIR